MKLLQVAGFILPEGNKQKIETETVWWSNINTSTECRKTANTSRRSFQAPLCSWKKTKPQIWHTFCPEGQKWPDAADGLSCRTICFRGHPWKLDGKGQTPLKIKLGRWLAEPSVCDPLSQVNVVQSGQWTAWRTSRLVPVKPVGELKS